MVFFDEAQGEQQVRRVLGPGDPERSVSIVDVSGRSIGLTKSVSEVIRLLEQLPSGVYFLETAREGRPPVRVLVP
jgi:hypothetical protein